MSDFYICPTCDNEVPVGPRGCAVCRKKEKKPKPRRRKRVAAKPSQKPTKRSWEQDDVYDGLDLPNDDFDYDDFCAKEFGTGPAYKRVGIQWYWWLTGVGLLGLFIYLIGAHLFFLW